VTAFPTTRSKPSPPPPAAVAPEYRATLERLYQRRRFGMRPGLEVVRELLDALGHPERRFPAIHVTGSKGKGSVAVMAAAILTAHGLPTGLFTSPHLVSYRERIRLDGTEIDPASVVGGIARVEAAADRLEREGRIDRPPTFFEVTTALALDWFATRGAKAAVVEVGIGGRLDSTNVLDSRVGVITTIELEHTDVLGPTLASIAHEKVGILAAGTVGILGTLPGEAAVTVQREAGSRGVPLWSLDREIRFDGRTLSPRGQQFSVRVPGLAIEDVRIPLLGGFQASNAALAVAASVRFLRSIGPEPDPDRIRKALARVRWPGRLERIAADPELFYDVAHTPESARALARGVAEISPLADPESSAIVFGCLRGKDVGGILEALEPLAKTLVLVPVRSDRGIPPAELRVAAFGRFPRIVLAPSAPDGVRLARAATGPDGLTLVAGSDYLIGELLRGEGPSDEPDLSDPGVGPPPSLPAASSPGRAGAGSAG
jgi:dihydrofolate synthase / folylpolyglutamate synthase